MNLAYGGVTLLFGWQTAWLPARIGRGERASGSLRRSAHVVAVVVRGDDGWRMRG